MLTAWTEANQLTRNAETPRTASTRRLRRCDHAHAVSRGTVALRPSARTPIVKVVILPRAHVGCLAHLAGADHRPAAAHIRRAVLGAVRTAPPEEKNKITILSPMVSTSMDCDSIQIVSYLATTTIEFR